MKKIDIMKKVDMDHNDIPFDDIDVVFKIDSETELIWQANSLGFANVGKKIKKVHLNVLQHMLERMYNEDIKTQHIGTVFIMIPLGILRSEGIKEFLKKHNSDEKSQQIVERLEQSHHNAMDWLME